jgi:5-methylcytosine-specific restriction endonuclease McrA
MTGRKPISKKARFEVFKRDGFTCQYCGATPPNVLLEVDHITPVCEGGENGEGNLVTACFNCNRGKAGISLSVVPKSLAEKAAEIQEREAQLAGYREIVQEQVDRIETDMWVVAEVLFPGCSEKGTRRDYLQSIKTFNKRLPLHEVIDAAEIARAKIYYSDLRMFKYFCGVCWKKLKDSE